MVLQASHMAVHMRSLQSLEQSLQLLLGCSALRPSMKERNDTMKKLTQAEYLPIGKLKPFDGHPFYVKDDDDMEQLTESIRSQGVLTPLVVRPLPNDEYEVISGHRRLHACKKAGIEMIPAFICSMDRSEAVVAMVDSNLHREKLLPSEKAFAYKMKMDAMKHQGTSSQLGTKIPVLQILQYGSSVHLADRIALAL